MIKLFGITPCIMREKEQLFSSGISFFNPLTGLVLNKTIISGITGDLSHL